MSGSFDFQRALAKYGADALIRVDMIRRASILELVGLIIDASPVDTGLFRGNWQCALNSPKELSLGTLDKGGNSAKAEALANLGALVDVFFLTNNLPYAERLEYGYSRQAPEGMVRVNVAKWNRIVEEKAKGYP